MLGKKVQLLKVNFIISSIVRCTQSPLQILKLSVSLDLATKLFSSVAFVRKPPKCWQRKSILTSIFAFEMLNSFHFGYLETEFNQPCHYDNSRRRDNVSYFHCLKLAKQHAMVTAPNRSTFLFCETRMFTGKRFNEPLMQSSGKCVSIKDDRISLAVHRWSHVLIVAFHKTFHKF